jgi:hypothetical protein
MAKQRAFFDPVEPTRIGIKACTPIRKFADYRRRRAGQHHAEMRDIARYSFKQTHPFESRSYNESSWMQDHVLFKRHEVGSWSYSDSLVIVFR